VPGKVHPEPGRPLENGLDSHVECEDGSPLAALGRSAGVLKGERRFAAAGRPEEDRVNRPYETNEQFPSSKGSKNSPSFISRKNPSGEAGGYTA
jgi:hypothetical protein